MKLSKSQRTKAVLIFSILVTLLVNKPSVKAEENHLIVSIVDAKYPPLIVTDDINNFTLFSFEFQVQIENPTLSNIQVNYTNSLTPFPCHNISLENETLVVSAYFIIEWVAGSFYISPGTIEKKIHSTIKIDNYVQEYLPEGDYSFWFDYINTCSVLVPVTTEKILVQVSETEIIYFYEYNNQTEIFEQPTPSNTEPIPTDQTKSFGLYSIIILFAIVIIRAVPKKKKFSKENFMFL